MYTYVIISILGTSLALLENKQTNAYDAAFIIFFIKWKHIENSEEGPPPSKLCCFHERIWVDTNVNAICMLVVLFRRAGWMANGQQIELPHWQQRRPPLE